jgi:hypothetical protein
MQQCAVYILYFTANLLYMFRMPFTRTIRSTGSCSRRPLVQVTCHDRLNGVASNPLESIHSQLLPHFAMVKLILLMNIKFSFPFCGWQVISLKELKWLKVMQICTVGNSLSRRYTELSKKMDGIWNHYNLKSTARIYTFYILKCSEKFRVLYWS